MNTTDNTKGLGKLSNDEKVMFRLAREGKLPMKTTDNTTDNTEFTSYKPTDNQPQFRLPPSCRYIECQDRETAEVAFAQLAVRPTALDHIRDLHDAATRFEDRAKRAEAQRDAAVAALRGLLASDAWQENIALEELPEIKQAHAVIAASQGGAQ